MDFAVQITKKSATDIRFYILIGAILLTLTHNVYAQQCPGTVVESLLGSATGNAIGRTINEADLRSAEQGFYKASRVAIGEKVFWHNECSGNWGMFIPVCDSNSRLGNYCRKFATEVCVEGRVTKGYGTACRQANGNWYLL